MNDITIEVYSSGTTLIKDPPNELALAEGIQFGTGYPGGLYLDASFTINREIAKWWALKGAQRLIIRDGVKIVYEGLIDDLSNELRSGSQGVQITATGYWGQLMRRRMRKRWADQRLTEDIWVWQTSGTAEDKCTFNRDSRLKFTPKNVAWTATTDYVSVKYTMPTGETIKEIDYDYNLAGSNFKISFYDATNGEQIIASTPGTAASETYTPTTPVQSIEFRYTCTSNTTPTSDGTYIAEIYNVTVKSETSAINVTEIVKDVASNFSTLIYTGWGAVNSNTLDLTPFIADDWETAADIMTRAADIGDSSNKPWAVGVLNSEDEHISTPIGKPPLYLEQFPDLTSGSYECALRLGEENIQGSFSLVQNFSKIWNWIIVRYTDVNGRAQYYTPDDDATLKDTTSISDYGQREYVLDVGHSTSTIALALGQRFLAEYKDPPWEVTQPVQVLGYIRDDDGQLVSAAEIRAGWRLLFEDFIDTTTGSGLTLRISSTNYTYLGGTGLCSISFGAVDPFIIPAMAEPLAGASELPEDVSGGATDVSHKKGWGRWGEQLSKHGYTKESWGAKSLAERIAIKKQLGLWHG